MIKNIYTPTCGTAVPQVASLKNDSKAKKRIIERLLSYYTIRADSMQLFC